MYVPTASNSLILNTVMRWPTASAVVVSTVAAAIVVVKTTPIFG